MSSPEPNHVAFEKLMILSSSPEASLSKDAQISSFCWAFTSTHSIKNDTSASWSIVVFGVMFFLSSIKPPNTGIFLFDSIPLCTFLRICCTENQPWRNLDFQRKVGKTTSTKFFEPSAVPFFAKTFRWNLSYFAPLTCCLIPPSSPANKYFGRAKGVVLTSFLPHKPLSPRNWTICVPSRNCVYTYTYEHTSEEIHTNGTKIPNTFCHFQ